MKEAEILKDVLKKLEILKFHGIVLWIRRLHNGLFYTNQGNPVKIGFKQNLDDGKDLDLVVVIKCDDGGISLLHIDTKRTGVSKFSHEQQIFVDSVKDDPRTFCAVVNDPKQLWPIIKDIKEGGNESGVIVY